MICDICHSNEASIHVTEIVNNQMQEIHICEECAKKKGIMMSPNFGLADFLANLTDFGLPAEKQALGQKQLKCPGCGLGFEDFKKIGRLGCGECYTAFKKGLQPLIRKIHGNLQHTGKHPEGAAGYSQETASLTDLEDKLKKAISDEAYEEAARLRDRIRAIKNNKDENK